MDAPRLEPLHPRHVASLSALAADPALAAEAPAALAGGDGAAWVQLARARAAAGREQRFAILDAAGQVVGAVGLLDLDADEATLVYFVDPRRWGRGLATSAARQVLALAFTRLGLRRVRARVRRDNAASRRVLEKLGFVPDEVAGEVDDDVAGAPAAIGAHYSLPASAWTCAG